MTTYRKSMREALNEVYLGENNMNLLKKAAGGAMQTLKMKDGKVKMDSFTASAIMQVYKAINPKNKKTMENVVNTGTITALQKLQSLAMRAIKSGDEVEHDGEELDEAKYDLYHKDFSSAMQHSYKMAKKLYGITIDPKEIDDKVATGPSKPGSGKTNKYRLKGDKGAIQVQVYNKGGSKPFELNMYKEEVELDEGPMDGFLRLTFNNPADVKKAMKVSDTEFGKRHFNMDKARTRPEVDFEGDRDDLQRLKDALKSAGIKFKIDLEEKVELDESKKALQNKADKSGVSYGILKKVYDRGMAAYKTGHRPGTTPQQWALARVNSFLTGGGARKADADLWKQAKGQKEEVELDEGKMSQLHQLMKDGKSAKEIAKIMKLDVKTIKALIGEDLDEKFDVKTAATKKGKISVTSFDNLKDAEKHLAGMEKKGHKGIISKDGKPVFRGTPAEIKKQMKDYKKKYDKIGIGEDITVTAATDGGIGQRDLDYVQKILRRLGIKDAVVDQNEMDKNKIDVQTKMSDDKVKKAFDKSKITVNYESARRDAMRAMRKDKEVDPADIDDIATDDDVKAASKNIIMQLRKSVSLRGNFPVEFMDKKKVKVDAKIAAAVQDKYNSIRKASDKQKFTIKVAKSYKDMLSALKEGFASDAQRRAAFASGYKEKGKKKKEELEKIKGKTPADDGRRAAVKDDIKDAEKKGDKKLVAKLKETTTILDRIGQKIQERKNG